MNDSIKGSFFFKGANKFFPSLLHALFHARDDVTISIAPGNLPTVKITPSGPQPYNRFCTFEAWQMPDGWSFVNYYTPGNSGMKNIIEETISFLIQRGYVFEEPPAVEAPQPDDQAGPPAVDEETQRRLTAVRGWPEAKSKGVKRRDYVDRLGISESGLTRWRDELRNRGFDVPDF